jgi:ketosteroid isomerase-like protein
VSQANVELARRSFEAFQEGVRQGNLDAGFDAGYATEDFEWVMPPRSPGFRRVYRGRDEFFEFMRTWTEDFDWEIELERLVDADTSVVGIYRQHARGRASGAPVELRMGVVYEFRDGRICRMTNFLDPAAALRAAGLEESA